jgi:hypothetical protein
VVLSVVDEVAEYDRDRGPSADLRVYHPGLRRAKANSAALRRASESEKEKERKREAVKVQWIPLIGEVIESLGGGGGGGGRDTT